MGGADETGSDADAWVAVCAAAGEYAEADEGRLHARWTSHVTLAEGGYGGSAARGAGGHIGGMVDMFIIFKNW